jgi:hypothetical protein
LVRGRDSTIPDSGRSRRLRDLPFPVGSLTTSESEHVSAGACP